MFSRESETGSTGTKLESRPYQIRVVDRVIQMFGLRASPATSAMIESPTGSGKTIMGLLIAQWLQRQQGYEVCWIAGRRNLLRQAQDENEQRGLHVKADFLTMFERQVPERLLKRERPLLLVVDEAHHDATRSMAHLHSTLLPQRILGLTATPFRLDKMKLCFEEVIRDAEIQNLIEQGYLSRFDLYTIPTYTPESVAESFLREPERWGRSLIFFWRSHECEKCRDILLQAGVRAELVTARSNREQQIEDFAAGCVQVLLSMALLTEGFDAPSLQTVFCRPSTRGCTIQMAGRVLRRFAASPVKQIVEASTSRYTFRKTAKPDQHYSWTESGWRTIDPNPRIAEVSRRMLQTIARTSVSRLPKVIADKTEFQDASPLELDED